MKAVLIDDEQLALDEIQYFLKDYDVTIVAMYKNTNSALSNIENYKPDVIFVDIDMPGMNGIDLVMQIQKILPNIIIVFITAHSEFAFDAYKVHPVDYILKPIRSMYFENTMKYVFKQYQLINQENVSNIHSNINKYKQYIQCFGVFEIKNDENNIMKFTTLKVKELLSYFICNADKTIYRDELLSLFLDSKENSNVLNNYYVTLHRLRNAIYDFGFTQDEINIGKNNSFFIIDGMCDLIDFQRYVKDNNVIDEKNRLQAENWIKLYNGVIFQDLDLDWTNELNEWVIVQMETLGLKLATYYKENNQGLKAETSLFKLMDINPLWTEGYEFLLKLYMDINDNDKYGLLYRRYDKLMKQELNLNIELKFRKYFNKIYD